jgi:hypothetical protein
MESSKLVLTSREQQPLVVGQWRARVWRHRGDVKASNQGTADSTVG